MTAIQVHTAHVIKKQDPRYPESDKYIALNAVDAPVVRLLDCYIHGSDRYLVLERAAPLDLDTRHPADFDRVIAWSLELSASQVPAYPLCDTGHISRHWEATTRLLELAGDVRSPLYNPEIAECPLPARVVEAFLASLQSDLRAIVHADPADFNLGTVRGRIVAFDLGLSCLGNPLTDLALRTGASTMPFPKHTDVRALVDRHIERLGLGVEKPFARYLLAGAIYGAYFEQRALDRIRTGEASYDVLSWARLTVQRYVHFTSQLDLAGLPGNASPGFQAAPSRLAF